LKTLFLLKFPEVCIKIPCQGIIVLEASIDFLGALLLFVMELFQNEMGVSDKRT
jgi:hypothetical protein